MFPLLPALLFFAGVPELPDRLPDGRLALRVDEWGTFTSIAGLNGSALRWAPLSGPGDLPCFVERLGNGLVKYQPGMVRMETPVLYFYSPRPLTASVRVRFPKGWITEWYPKATSLSPSSLDGAVFARDGRIEWRGIEVQPDAKAPEFPVGKGASHYYAARNTSAAPLRVGTQWEKLLFYRGLGNFEPPLHPTFDRRGSLRVQSDSLVPLMIWFENRNGEVSFRTLRDVVGEVQVQAPAAKPLGELLSELTNHLTEAGLLRKEAEAMVETWRDSWFEAGSRLIYLMPRGQVDELLPLEIEPAPTALHRVFVGRTELLAPWVREAMRAGRSQQFGRFATTFYAEMERAGDPALAPRILVDRSAACVE